MARTALDALITEKSLTLMSVGRNEVILDLIADDRIEHNVPLKNVCAKVSPQLADEIDQICGLLDISKRRFLETAFIEAVQKARAIMEAEGVFDYLEERTSRSGVQLEAVEGEEEAK